MLISGSFTLVTLLQKSTPGRSRVRDPMKFTGSDDVTVGHYKAKRDEAVVMTSQVSGLASHLVHHRDVISCPELPRRFFTSC